MQIGKEIAKMNNIEVAGLKLKSGVPSQPAAATITAGGETYKVYKTDSDTLLISREDGNIQNEQDLLTNGTVDDPYLLNDNGLLGINVSKTTSKRDINPSELSSWSTCNTGFKDIDDDLCSLETLLSFRVHSIVPCLSNTEQDKDVTPVLDSLSLYKQLQTAECDTNLHKTGQSKTNIAAEEPKTIGTGSEKPPYHYSDLIEFALVEKNMLAVHGIYEWIKDKFPYFRTLEESRWKPAIRHTLTTNSNFVKAKKAHRGYMWAFMSDEDRKKQSVKWSSTKNQNHWKKQKLAEYESSNTCTINKPDHTMGMCSNMMGTSNSLLKNSLVYVNDKEGIKDMGKCFREKCAKGKCYDKTKPVLSRSLMQDMRAKTAISDNTTNTITNSSGFYTNSCYNGYGMQGYHDRLLPVMYRIPDKHLKKGGAQHPAYFMPSRAYLNPVPQDVALEESGLSPPNSHTLSAVPSSSSIGVAGSGIDDFELENLLPVQPSPSQTLLA